MTCLIRLLAVLLLTAGPLRAADILVRAGEHGDFTRVVLHLPVGQGWRAQQDAASVTITLDDPPHRFLTNTLFDLIDRRRLASVSSGNDGVLTLTLGCACQATWFLHDGRLLVVDIAPGVAGIADQSSPASTSRPVPRADSVLPLIVPLRASSFLLPSLEGLAAEAATTGLLSLDRHISIDRSDLPQMRPYFTGSTGARPTSDAAQSGAARVLSCPPGASQLTRIWAGSDGFSAEKARLWSGLINGQGEEDPDARLALARFYVSQALAPEARQLIPDDGSEASLILLELARVIAGDAPTGINPFQRCPGLVIWAFLDDLRADRTRDTGWDTEGLAQGFRDLSPVLQDYFADELVKGLRRVGLVRDADRITVFRRWVEPSETVFLPDGSAHHPSPPADADSRPVAAVERLLPRFATLDAARQTSPDDRALIEAFLFEYRDRALEPKIWAATVRARLVDGRFAEGLELTISRRDDFPDAFPQVAQDVLDAVVTGADDILFLKLALAIRANAHPFPPPDGLQAAAFDGRLAALGY